MTNKKMTIKRIIIFVVLAYLLAGIPVVVAYLCGVTTMEHPAFTLISCGMFGPALSSILTRVITGEGFQHMYLRVNWKGHGMYYLVAILFPVVLSIVEGIVETMIYGGFYSHEIFSGLSLPAYIAYIFYGIAMGVVQFFVALGEELGWRGYLTPKLQEVMGMPGAMVLSGIIWGLWHTPMILLYGLNYGTEHPVLGMLAMCFSCFGMGNILTLITMKSDSIYPAAIAHGVWDSVVSLISVLFITNQTAVEHAFEIGLVDTLVMFVFGMLPFVLLVRGAGKKKSSLEETEE